MTFRIAGINERAPESRRRVCDCSARLGVILDADANSRGGDCISAPESRVSALGAKNATFSFNTAMVRP